jgi:hypothetical protein
MSQINIAYDVLRTLLGVDIFTSIGRLVSTSIGRSLAVRETSHGHRIHGRAVVGEPCLTGLNSKMKGFINEFFHALYTDVVSKMFWPSNLLLIFCAILWSPMQISRNHRRAIIQAAWNWRTLFAGSLL